MGLHSVTVGGDMAKISKELRSLRQHRVPAWWQDAKLGIFIHWTMAAVPAYAPIGIDFASHLKGDIADSYSLSPYVEWYQNSLRFPNSPVAKFHQENFGDQPYEEFREPFEAGFEHWDADEWAATFKATGASYVVMVAKHSDGYCLWPTAVENPHRPGWHSSRDIVGEMATAVRKAGMKFGLYYCAGMDWTFNQWPIGSMADVIAAIPRGDFPAYANAQVRELIDRYQPSVLWNDIAWPDSAKTLWPLFAYYYEQVPDGVVNDRWLPWSPLMKIATTRVGKKLINSYTLKEMRKNGGLIPPPPPHFDARTPEYVSFPDVQRTPWECCRGMDESFGYNAYSREEDFLTHEELLWLITDITAKGGNLLLNVGPTGRDAAIPEPQRRRLTWLGEWLAVNAEAIVGTRPWVRCGTTVNGDLQVRYTAKGPTVFAIVNGHPTTVRFTDILDTPTTRVTDISGNPLVTRVAADAVEVDLPENIAPGPVVVVLHEVSARPV